MYAIRLESAEEFPRVKNYFLQCPVVRKDGNHDFGSTGLAYGVRWLCAYGAQLISAGPRPVVDNHGMSGGKAVARDRPAHCSGSNDAHSHLVLISILKCSGRYRCQFTTATAST